MSRVLAIAGCALAATGLSGCVAAAAVPLAAAAGVVKSSQDQKARKRDKRERGQTAPAPKPGETYRTEDGKTVVITGLTALPPPNGGAGGAASPVQPAGSVPPEMQFLYGSGEASALSLQAYAALWAYVHGELRFRRDKSQISSVVMTRDSTLTSPKFDSCGKRPLAVVFDVDETVLLNLGFESDAARRGPGAPYDQARWTRWEETGAAKVEAVPGAAETIAAIRGDGITVIFNTNRSASTAAQTVAALEGAGLGNVVPGETLFLREDGAPSGKDERRWKIAERYCIVAMGGDQLGDFSDLFNAPGLSVPARRNTTGNTLIAPLWGRGWFILPNPVYGTGLKGAMDEVFPKDKQWADPAEEKK